MVSKQIDVMEIQQHEDRIFNEVCDIVRKLKSKHFKTGYVVRLERSGDEIELGSDPPKHYSAWIFVSLNRNRTLLESGRDSGEWPGVCDEILRVKSFFGKNKKLIVSDTYESVLKEELEGITHEYETNSAVYVENKEASDAILAKACRVEWID